MGRFIRRFSTIPYFSTIRTPIITRNDDRFPHAMRSIQSTSIYAVLNGSTPVSHLLLRRLVKPAECDRFEQGERGIIFSAPFSRDAFYI